MNMGTMFFVAATGALGIDNSDGVDDTGLVFVGLYLILFAAGLFIYEMAQFTPCCGVIDDFMKKNFGFMYGIFGKSFYIMM